MKKNIGSKDAAFRALLVIALGLGVAQNGTQSSLGMILAILALVLFATIVFNFCPLYALIGISTNKK